MSHNLLFKRYVDGKEAPYDLAKLRSILERHGADIRGPRKVGTYAGDFFVVLFPAQDDGDDISGDEAGIFVEATGVIEFGIGRPIYGERLKRLAFELLQSLEICMHPDFGEEAFTVHLRAEHLPKDLLESCPKGLTTVREPGDLW